MRVYLFPFALALSCLSFAQDVSTSTSQTGTITIFRERATSRAKMFSMKDQWPVRLHKKLTLDGKPLLDMHGQEFASFQLPVGRHLIEFENYGGPNAAVNLNAGERVFVRPGFVGGSLLGGGAKYVITFVPCSEAIELGRDSQPMEGHYISDPRRREENQFPSECAQN